MWLTTFRCWFHFSWSIGGIKQPKSYSFFGFSGRSRAESNPVCFEKLRKVLRIFSIFYKYLSRQFLSTKLTVTHHCERKQIYFLNGKSKRKQEETRRQSSFCCKIRHWAKKAKLWICRTSDNGNKNEILNSNVSFLCEPTRLCISINWDCNARLWKNWN